MIPRCPNCQAELTPAQLAGLLARSRTPEQRKGGPKLKRKRCPCRKNTMRRAQARGFECCKAAGVPITEYPAS